MHLSDPIPSSSDSPRTSERRNHPRQSTSSLAYVHLDETNGGILINVSEGGLAVQAAMSLIEDELPRVRLQIPHSKTWLEMSARVAWTGDSRRMIGLEFLDVPEDSRKSLRDWLAAESPDKTPTVAAVPAPSEHEIHAVRELEVAVVRRPAPVPRIQPQRAKDADVAALIAAREAAAIAAARAAQQTASASAPIAPVTPVSQAVVAKAEKPRSANRYTPVLVALCALSLMAGWAAGHGNALQLFSGLFPSGGSPVAAAAVPGLASAAANSASVDFEVVDASNQSWLVPFAGPTFVPQNTPSQVIPPRPAPAERPSPETKSTFKVGALSAPKSAAHSNSAQVNAAAPVLQTDSSAALPSAILSSTPGINLARPGPTAPSSILAPAQLLRHADPIYPPEALLQRIDGAVKIHAHINEDGSLSDVTATSGSRLLEPAAVDAVKKWKYKPEMLDGHPLASDVEITVQFTLPQ